MAKARFELLRDVFRPKLVRIGTIAIGALAGWDSASNQLGLPKLSRLWGMSGSLLPWWGWLLILQAVFVYALFEYVRRLPAAPAPVEGPHATGDSNQGTEEFQQRLALIEERQKELGERDDFAPLVAAERRLSTQCRASNEVNTRATNTVQRYKETVAQAGNNGLAPGAGMVRSMVEEALSSAIETVREAERHVGIVDEPNVRRPDTVGVPGNDRPDLFRAENNGRFLMEHEDNGRILEGKLQTLRTEEARKGADLARVRSQINDRLRDLDGEA